MRIASHWVLLAIAAAGIWTASSARAEEPKENSDVKFVKEANQINLAEIEIGKLVPDRTVNSATKKHGQQLIQDHKVMNDELTTLARKKGISLAKELDSKNQEVIDRLSAMKGSEFERALLCALIDGHKKAIEKFEAEFKNGRDAEVKAWAEKRLETLREHLKMARDNLTSG